MNTSQDDLVDLWRLTAEQRRQIYEEEKRRIAETSPMFSKMTKIIVAIYVLGCLLLYSGVTQAVVGFWCTHTWKLQPEPDFFWSLLGAAVSLTRPFLAVVGTFWAVAIPPLILWGFWVDIVRFVKRLMNRHNR
jgi:hypothetical protein